MMATSNRPPTRLSRPDLALLLLLVVAHGLSNYYILQTDTLPRVRHDAYFFKMSYDVLRHWTELDLSARFGMAETYPLLFIDLATPLFLLFGHTPDIGAMTNLIFLAVLVFALYGLGRHLFSTAVGLLAAFLATTFPHLFGMSRNFTLDYPMAAMVVLAFWALVKTDFFRSRSRSLLFGICVGLGVSTKTVFLATFLGPFFFYLAVAFHRPREYEGPRLPPRERAANLGLALLVAFGIAALWNGASLRALAKHAGHSMEADTVAVRHTLFYVQRLFCYQLLGPYSTLLLLSLATIAAGQKKWTHYFLLLWIVLPILIFTFAVPMNQDPRFTIPILPAAAVAMAVVILLPRRRWIKRAMACVVVLFGVFQYTLICFFPLHAGLYNRLNQKLDCHDLIVSPREFPYFSWQRGLLCPREAGLPVDSILETLTAAHRRAGRTGTRRPVLVLSRVRPDRGYLHDILFNASIALTGNELYMDYLPEQSPLTDEEIARALSGFDYVVYTEVAMHADPSPEEYSGAAGYFLDHLDRYSLLDTFVWLDGRRIDVYQSIEHLPNAAEPLPNSNSLSQTLSQRERDLRFSRRPCTDIYVKSVDVTIIDHEEGERSR